MPITLIYASEKMSWAKNNVRQGQRTLSSGWTDGYKGDAMGASKNKKCHKPLGLRKGDGDARHNMYGCRRRGADNICK